MKERDFKMTFAFKEGGLLTLRFATEGIRDAEFEKVCHAKAMNAPVLVEGDETIKRIYMDTDSVMFVCVKDMEIEKEDDEEKKNGEISVPDREEVVDFFKGRN